MKSEMSFKLARLDTSKPCDSHAMVMRKERRRGLAARKRTFRALGQEAKGGRVRCYRTPPVVSGQRDEVKAMAASGTIARASLVWPAFAT